MIDRSGNSDIRDKYQQQICTEFIDRNPSKLHIEFIKKVLCVHMPVNNFYFARVVHHYWSISRLHRVMCVYKQACLYGYMLKHHPSHGKRNRASRLATACIYGVRVRMHSFVICSKWSANLFTAVEYNIVWLRYSMSWLTCFTYISNRLHVSCPNHL